MNEFSNDLSFYRNYYKKLKEKYLKRRDSVASDEEKAKYNIKIGIVSYIKSQKNVNLKSKYFNDVQKCLEKSTNNLYSYHYGNNDTFKLNYYEIKANGDWIFKLFDIIKDNNSFEDNLNFFNQHLIIFFQ